MLRLLALEDAVDVAGGAPENKVVELDIVDRANDSTIGRTRQRAGWLVRGGTEIWTHIAPSSTAHSPNRLFRMKITSAEKR